MNELMTMKEIRTMLGIGRTAGYSLINNTSFPAPINVSSKCLRWVRTEVMEWLNAQKNRDLRPIKKIKYTKNRIVFNGVVFRERA
jgi:predicted DNA-binding transcriptional regulator AlpA